MDSNSQPESSENQAVQESEDHQHVTQSQEMVVGETSEREDWCLGEGSDDNKAVPQEPEEKTVYSDVDICKQQQTSDARPMHVGEGGGSINIVGGSGIVAAVGNIVDSTINIKQRLSGTPGDVTNIIENKTEFAGGQKITHYGDRVQNVSQSSNFVAGGFTSTGQTIEHAGQGSAKGGKVRNEIKETTTFQGDQITEHHGDVVQNISDSKDFLVCEEIEAQRIIVGAASVACDSGDSTDRQQATSPERRSVVSGLSNVALIDLLREKSFQEKTILKIQERNVNGDALEFIVKDEEALNDIACDHVDKCKLKALMKEKA
ncbi:uncharacterized protein LOC121375663 [Gigantopelta aegis]|uniref:uncharacterized protein LOC121375663 n=1 Tax=Gigantopelta aegis TaxID=1735272 RepID=UPI001B88C697|nr:uncharacterized protein LOC121375663 [Gigantopelta aegis]